MINRIIEFSANNRFLVFLFVIMAVFAGLYAMRHITLDAIPDLSDTQVIIYSRWDRSPDILEDQVTYPDHHRHARDSEGQRIFADFPISVFLTFTSSLRTARIFTGPGRERSNISAPSFPSSPREYRSSWGGMRPPLAGCSSMPWWILRERAIWPNCAPSRIGILRFELQSVPGVAEVAPIGGFVRQYQVNLDPNALLAYNIPVERVVETIRAGNNDVGGRLVEFSGREYMVRGRGYIRSATDIENIVVGTNPDAGVPILVKHLGKVALGPDIRRGVAELDGEGETVGAIVIMRYGENALTVIDRIKAKLSELERGLPPGVKIVTTYDRSDLIDRSIETLKATLIEELLIVSLVILIFLWHIPSAIIPILTIPITVILAFIPMYGMKLTANIMSLGGIAIAIGAMVDAAIVVVEQTHKKLEHWDQDGRPGNFKDVVIGAVKEVGGPSFFALLVIAISFMPIFTLEAQEGRMFKPLAYTKTFSMVIAAFLAITLDPAIRLLFTHMQNYNFRPRWLCRVTNAILVGKIHSEENHPISRPLMKIYHPIVEGVLRHQWATIVGAFLVVLLTVPVFLRLGSEFMPPLDEGALLYMPTTVPGISVTEAQKILQLQDKVIKSFPQVERVFGKAGRAETATDPAPFSMMETTILLKPHSQWPKVPRWYSEWAPEWLQGMLRRAWPDYKSTEEFIYGPGGLNEAMQFPGVVNAWTMPIKARVDMLSTGVRTPVGIKVLGKDLDVIQELGQHLERVLKDVRGHRQRFRRADRRGLLSGF